MPQSTKNHVMMWAGDMMYNVKKIFLLVLLVLSTVFFQVDYQGNVTLLTQGIYMTKCQIDVTHYPFDPQVPNSVTIYSLNFTLHYLDSRFKSGNTWFSEVLFEICVLDHRNNTTKPVHWWVRLLHGTLISLHCTTLHWCKCVSLNKSAVQIYHHHVFQGDIPCTTASAWV